MSSDFHFERTAVAPDIVLWQMFGEPTELGWEQLLQEAERWLSEQESRGKKWGIIVDPTGLASASAALRRASGKWRARNMPLIANTCACASYVADNAMWRGAITAVFWFAKPVIPVRVHASREEAQQWLVSKMNALSLAY